MVAHNELEMLLHFQMRMRQSVLNVALSCTVLRVKPGGEGVGELHVLIVSVVSRETR